MDKKEQLIMEEAPPDTSTYLEASMDIADYKSGSSGKKLAPPETERESFSFYEAFQQEVNQIG